MEVIGFFLFAIFYRILQAIVAAPFIWIGSAIARVLEGPKLPDMNESVPDDNEECES